MGKGWAASGLEPASRSWYLDRPTAAVVAPRAVPERARRGMSTPDDPEWLRPDDLRRYASALAAAAGMAPARAAALASHLLWFDTAGLPAHGIRTLPGWLDRLARGDVQPRAEGRVGPERAGTAVLDGQRGVPPLILARAAGIAVEKARELGVGVVRVHGLGPTGPAAPIAAEVALGPHVAAVLGPRPSWALALPAPDGLPIVLDSELMPPGAAPRPAPGLDHLAPWAAALAGDGGWLVLALAIPALEGLGTFHERVAAVATTAAPGAGVLLPGPWDAHRRAARERGLPIPPEVRAELRRHAQRLDVAPW